MAISSWYTQKLWFSMVGLVYQRVDEVFRKICRSFPEFPRKMETFDQEKVWFDQEKLWFHWFGPENMWTYQQKKLEHFIYFMGLKFSQCSWQRHFMRRKEANGKIWKQNWTNKLTMELEEWTSHVNCKPYKDDYSLATKLDGVALTFQQSCCTRHILIFTAVSTSICNLPLSYLVTGVAIPEIVQKKYENPV